MRALLRKDLRILRRSPLLVAMLVLYPLLIALLLGFALSRGPSKPPVAIYNGLADAERGSLTVGGTSVDPREYANELFKSVQPIEVGSRQAAIDKVRSGQALAAIIVPADLIDRLQQLVALNSGKRPQVEVVYSGRDPVKRSFVESAINAKVADLNRAVSQRLTEVAASYIGLLLHGGNFNLLGTHLDITGLVRSKQKIDEVAARLPAHSPDRLKLEQVAKFAGMAIDNLDLSTGILGTVGAPVVVKKTVLAGSSGAPLDRYAVAVAVTLSLLLIGVLIAAGMLALEREENTLERLLRGLLAPSRLIAAKVILAAGCAALAGLILSAGVAAFLGLDFARLPLWLLALAAGGLGCAAFGVGLGALAREVRAASLLAILVSLPLAFVALVPQGALAGWLYDVVRGVSALFPFRPGLTAINSALNAAPGLWLAVAHLLLVTVGWALIGRLALRRMA